eukprot:5853490-Amphidinium_carterae.1
MQTPTMQQGNYQTDSIAIGFGFITEVRNGKMQVLFAHSMRHAWGCSLRTRNGFARHIRTAGTWQVARQHSLV